MHLTSAEADTIAARIAAVEARTGVQIVTAVVGRAARYPEARWKAFALGVSVASLIVVVVSFAMPGWGVAGATLPGIVGTTLGGIAVILAVGITLALLATRVDGVARAFVRHNRAEAEVRQYAEGFFLARGLFATPARTTVLVVVSVFERVVVVHADRGFDGRILPSEWETVVASMMAPLGSGQRASALEAGLAAIEQLLVRTGFVATRAGENVLPDRPYEERGA